MNEQWIQTVSGTPVQSRRFEKCLLIVGYINLTKISIIINDIERITSLLLSFRALKVGLESLQIFMKSN